MTMQTGAELSVRLRTMAADDLATAHKLSRQIKWPHRLEDWESFLRVGQGVVAEQDGKLVGTVMGWTYGPDVASLGMVIVAPGLQGQGIGRRMMETMIERLDNRAILLNATAEGLPLYERLGFQPIGTIHQHQGTAFTVPIAELGPNERIRPVGRGDEGAIVELDRKASGGDRGALFAELLREKAQGVVLDRDGEAIGFSFYRRFGRGYLVGPTVAPDERGAKALISHWLGSNAGIFSRLDVPGDSALCEWLDDLGLAGAGKVTTMVRGTAPARVGPTRNYSIAAQALG
jgi:predicted N-acetyltransferase YhbS